MPETLLIPDLGTRDLFPHPTTGELQPVERIYVMTPAGFGSYYQAGPFEDGLVALQFTAEAPAPTIITQLKESSR
tara:strand:- start:6708 stop:6932 length:225 start_codon:yes stop_codon:yes gene_type:complete